jgi:uncharacterized membrane protein YeaQ/YmgE (transglycosylase-associated protein family)
MTLELFAMWVALGLLIGWVAGYVMPGGGYGLIGDISLGVMGSLAGSGLFLYLAVSPDAGLVASIVVACLGAAALIFAQHQFLSVPA